MDNSLAIKVQNVSKAFKLPHEKHSSIKGAMINMLRRKRTYEKQQVLKEVSFEIRKGEFFGIVGRNGSGKSTLLKLLAGIYAPDKGNITLNGNLTPFIELGVGFNPELTGRENVYLNGALLGFNRKEVQAMYDEIVQFAELRKFMDQKLKNYSSGMQVRLAFSIAIQAKSEILLLDEVLAVGDEAFQRKCLDVFERYKAEKQTVILVTHDMDTVRKYCSRAMLVGEGKIITKGTADKVASHYTKLNLTEIVKSVDDENQKHSAEKSVLTVNLMNTSGKRSTKFEVGQKLVVELEWPKDVPAVYSGVAILKMSGEYIFGTNTLSDKHRIHGNKLVYTTKLDLAPGKYRVEASLSGARERDVLAYVENGPQFIITSNPNDKSGGLVRLPHEWGQNV